MCEPKIVLHKACKVVDYDGVIFDSKILENMPLESIVRVSMVFSPNYDRYDLIAFTHDSPYIKILKKDKELLLGEVLEDKRTCDEDKYPIRTGERVWFSKENIIEIPLHMQSYPQKILAKYRTANKVPITGPLYTIIEEPLLNDIASDSDSD